jgi:hypothetical protein
MPCLPAANIQEDEQTRGRVLMPWWHKLLAITANHRHKLQIQLHAMVPKLKLAHKRTSGLKF